MSAKSADRRSITELRRMDEQTAMQTLTMAEYQRWESVNDHHERAEQVRQEWRETEQDADEILRHHDISDLASEVELFGNDCLVYYDPEDKRVRNIADRLADALGVDLDGRDVSEIEASADDVSEEDIGPAKDVLADFLELSLREWNGHTWSDLPVKQRTELIDGLKPPDPDGWGLYGLMDAMNTVMVAVEENRDERLGRVEKFRNPERRGNR